MNVRTLFHTVCFCSFQVAVRAYKSKIKSLTGNSYNSGLEAEILMASQVLTYELKQISQRFQRLNINFQGRPAQRNPCQLYVM